MNSIETLRPSEFIDLLLHVAPVRPVLVLGQPGIGKSALVERFAADVGLPGVSLLGCTRARAASVAGRAWWRRSRR